MARLRNCRTCMAVTAGWQSPSGALLCSICNTPLPPGKVRRRDPEAELVARLRARERKDRARVQRQLEEQELRDFERYKAELRHRDTGEDVAELSGHEWLRSDPGYPLGADYPPGPSLREDGQSHRGAWMSILRRDPCSYCGGPGGTVDHIEPTARGGRNVWMNYTGACGPCNGSKTDMLLLVDGDGPGFLLKRGVLA